MSEMPETIWAQVTIRNPNCGTYAVAPAMDVGNVRYRRADLPPTLSAAMQLPEVWALKEALRALLQAICGPTGFAEAVRLDSGLAYPWPALENAELQSRSALAAIKEPKT